MTGRVVKGGNKTLKREVTAEEVAKFQRNTKDYWLWRRAEIIRLAAAGYNNLEIAEITEIDEKNVRLWINRFNAEGFAGLFRRKGGKRDGKLSEEQVEELKRALNKPPAESGYGHVAWTVKLVREDVYELRREGKNFKFIWLPRYSPELSPIEQLWKPLRRNVHNTVINAKNRLISVVKQELNLVSQSAKGLLAKYFPIIFG